MVLQLLAFAAALVAADPAAGALEIDFDLQGRRGEVVAALFDSEAAWKARRQPVRTARVAAGQTVVVTDLPPGRYGVMAFLDVNGNGRLDTLPIGLPTEPYGFSRNARGLFGPPSWSAAAIDVNHRLDRQVIVLR